MEANNIYSDRRWEQRCVFGGVLRELGLFDFGICSHIIAYRGEIPLNQAVFLMRRSFGTTLFDLNWAR